MPKSYKQNLATSLLIAALLFAVGATLYLPSRSASLSASAQEVSNQVYNQCHKNANGSCYQDVLIEVVTDYGLPFGVSVLTALQEKDPAVRFCHSLAHEMGAVAVANEPEKWSALVKEIDPMGCSGGYFHGVLEGHAGATGGRKLDAQEITNLCGNAFSFQAGTCAHLLGHLLMVDTLGSIPEALGSCELYSVETLERECFSGVFMENMTKENLLDHGLAQQKSWDLESINENERLCRKYDGQIAMACWGEMAHMYAAVYNDDTPTVFKLCKNSGTDNLAEYCYLRSVAKMSVTLGDQAKINTICNIFTETESARMCISYAINSMLNNSKAFLPRAEMFCEHTGNNKSYCLEAIKNNQKR